jgi:hypothetical protein
VKADPDMIGGGTFLDAFKPGQTICYWRADRAAEEPIASEIYTPSEDGEYNVNPANAHLWYMVCGDADGEAAPRNQNSYILLSRGKDGEWGYRDSTGNAVDEFPSAEGRCDDIGNFEK